MAHVEHCKKELEKLTDSKYGFNVKLIDADGVSTQYMKLDADFISALNQFHKDRLTKKS